MPPKRSATPVFEGDTFCVSGSFSISQGDMKELIDRKGGQIAATPNKSCTYLVSDQIGSAKTLKAEKDGIAIVTEEWVHQSIKAGKKSTDATLFLANGPAKGGKASSKVAPANDSEEEEEQPKKKKAAPKKAAAPVAKPAAGVFDGEVFCVSGAFSVTQAAMRALVITNGGEVVDTPNKRCTFLISDQLGSAKTAKAQKDGIDIVTEEWVNESISAGKKSTDPAHFLSGGGAAADDDDDEEDAKPKLAPAKRMSPAASSAAADDDDDTAVPASKAKSTSSGSGSGSGSGAVRLKKVVVKGSAPVDDLCPVHASTHVYSPSADEVYDAMLNQVTNEEKHR